MTDGRTLQKYARVYANGYDLSGETRSIGALEWNFAQAIDKCLTWEVGGGLNGTATIKTGTINTVLRFHTTPASSPHDWLAAMNGAFVNLMIPQGVRAAPAMGDPTWIAVQLAHIKHSAGEGLMTVTMDFDPSFLDGSGGNLLTYDIPWGRLLHAMSAETDANSADDNVDNGDESTAGGWLMYQINAIAGGAGTATVSVDDSANGTDWAALADATSGAIAYNAAPTSGIVQLSTTATVRQYLRWQLALAGGATGATFSLAFVRGR